MTEVAELDWFYILDDAQVGPVSTVVLEGMLRSGMLPASARVWCEALPEWVSAEMIEEFAEAVEAGRQAFPTVAEFPPPVPAASVVAPVGQLKSVWKVAMLCSVACGISACCIVVCIIMLVAFLLMTFSRAGSDVALSVVIRAFSLSFTGSQIVLVILWLLLFPMWVFRARSNCVALGAKGFALPPIGAALLSLPILRMFSGLHIVTSIVAASTTPIEDRWRREQWVTSVGTGWYRAMMVSVFLLISVSVVAVLGGGTPAHESPVQLALGALYHLSHLVFLGMTSKLVRSVAELQQAAARWK